MCRNYIDQLTKTARLLHGHPLHEPGAEVEERLVDAAATVDK